MGGRGKGGGGGQTGREGRDWGAGGGVRGRGERLTARDGSNKRAMLTKGFVWEGAAI